MENFQEDTKLFTEEMIEFNLVNDFSNSSFNALYSYISLIVEDDIGTEEELYEKFEASSIKTVEEYIDFSNYESE